MDSNSLLVLIPMSLAGIVFASLKSTYFLGYKGYKLGEDGLLEGFLYEMDHIFVNGNQLSTCPNVYCNLPVNGFGTMRSNGSTWRKIG